MARLKVYTPYSWGDLKAAISITGFRATWLKQRRKSGELIEGIHWVKRNSRVVRYNLTLLEDFIRNSNNPTAHQQAIERFLVEFPAERVKPPSRGAA